MKFSKKYIPFFLSVAVLAATSSTHHIDAAKKDKKKKSLFTKIKKSFTKFVTGKWKKMSENDWLRVVGTTVFAGVSGYGFYWMFFKKSIVDIQHPRTPDPNPTYNPPAFYNNRLNDHVTLRQVPATPQGPNNTCGLHALLNGIKVVNALNADVNALGNLAAVLINDQSQRLINERIGQQGFWRQLIINRRRELNGQARARNSQIPARMELQRERLARGEIQRVVVIQPELDNRPLNGENLTGAEVERLIAFERGNDDRRILGQGIQSGFTAYDSIVQINHPQADIDMPIVRQNLARDGAYFHVFLIRAGGGNFGNGGHWYTLVLHKTADGQHHYITMDSSGANNGWFNVRLNQGVTRIIRALEGQATVQAMQPQPQPETNNNTNS